jgi:polyhydroxybutyrate depolymerase
MERLTAYRFNQLADQEGFFVVYPDGLGRRWNAGQNEKKDREKASVDDVGFLCSLVDTLLQRHPVDKGRVYVTGMSNGGMMAFRLALERSSKFAAAASVGAAMPAGLLPGPAPARPVPMMIISGTEDPLIPWEGDRVRFLGLKLSRILPVEDGVQFWVRRNGGPGKADYAFLSDRDPRDGATVWSKRYPAPPGGGEVLLLAVEGGGHTWPGGWQYLSRALIGNTCRDLNACDAIWSFFEKHALEGNGKSDFPRKKGP